MVFADSVLTYMITCTKLSYVYHIAYFIVTPPRHGSGVDYCHQSVCVSVHEHASATAGTIFANFVPILVAVVQSSAGGVAILYVLPVLWMTSRLAAMGPVAHFNTGANFDVYEFLVFSCGDLYRYSAEFFCWFFCFFCFFGRPSISTLRVITGLACRSC